MERKDIGSCSLCNKLRDELKILPCAHNFCLKCLESWVRSSDSPKCPQCDVAFKIPRGGLKDLKKNEFLEYLNKLLANKSKCDSCNENQAVNFCIDCSFHYCLTCLQYHGKNPASRKHRLKQTEVTEIETFTPDKYKVCEVHSEAMNLYCEDCSVFTCCVCFASNHNTHKVKHIYVKVDEKKKYLDLKIKTSEEDFLVTVAKFQMTERRLCGCKTKAAKLKKEIQQRGEAIKGLVDSIVAEMSGKVDKELAQHEEEAGVVLKKLKEMQTDLNVQIETLKQKLSNLNFQNVVEISSEEFEEIKDIPTYVKIFQMSLSTYNSESKSNLEKIFGFLKTEKSHEVRIAKEVQPQLQKQFSLHKGAVSFAVGHDDIYVVDDTKIHIHSVSDFAHKSSIDLQNVVNCIYAIEIIDDILYVNVRDVTGTFKILKITFFENYKTEIVCILTGDRDNWKIYRLSKLKNGCLIILSGCYIEIISQSGSLVKTINFSAPIYNAVEYDDKHFVVCSHSFVGIIDHNGSIINTFINTAAVSHNFGVAADKFRNVFICKPDGQALIFHHYNEFATCHTVGEYIYKAYYDEHRNVLWCQSWKDGKMELQMFSL